VSESLTALEQQRTAILQEMVQLPDFRSGSITTTSGPCGKTNCRCRQPNQPGQHGPNFRLTRKVNGKTVTETFATPAEFRKAQSEVEAFHRFRCQLPPHRSQVSSPLVARSRLPWDDSAKSWEPTNAHST